MFGYCGWSGHIVAGRSRFCVRFCAEKNCAREMGKPVPKVDLCLLCRNRFSSATFEVVCCKEKRGNSLAGSSIQFVSDCIALPFQPILLTTNDATRPANPQPSDGLVGIHQVMFHHVAGDKRTRPTDSACKENERIE